MRWTRRHTVPGGRLKSGRRVWAFAAVVLVGIGVSTILSLRPLVSGGREITEVRRTDLALQRAGDLRTTLAEWQVYIEPHIATFSTRPLTLDPADLATGSKLVETAIANSQLLATSLRTLGLQKEASNLERSQAALTASIAAIGPMAAGSPDEVRARVVAGERAAFTQLWLLTSTTSGTVRQMRDTDLQQSGSYLDNGRVTMLAVEALSALAVFGTAIVVGRRSQRRERNERDKVMRHDFETTLQRALEMAETEADAYIVVNRALDASVPNLQVEMLLADSSRAHFHQMFVTDSGPDARTGCGVVSPLLCPATNRGHTVQFPSSAAIDACPYLQGRATGDCSAACVPVSIAGKTVGVLHATGPDTVAPTESDVRYVEVTARRAAERIAMLRAFEKSETQARSDPLTGLLNRRSLENQVNDLERTATPYSLAYGDLDHFKVLNDTHGHEAGDQALRLFSRVLRDSVRPADIAARYGGEEFVVVLPDCNVETATAVLERVRERLALALTNGRVPSFTVSFGLAASAAGDTFDEIVALADHALLAAKSEGRNRVVLAAEGQTPESAEPEPVGSE